jgi:hypothetical protein
MPPRNQTRQPIDPNQPVEGSDRDRSLPESNEAAEETNRGKPEPGKIVHFRGKVTELPELTEARGRKKAYIGAEGALVTNDGEVVTEPREWTIIAYGYQAEQAKKHLQVGEDVQAAGRWLEARFVARGVSVDNEIQAFDISRPLDAGVGLTAAPELGSVADGGGLSV